MPVDDRNNLPYISAGLFEALRSRKGLTASGNDVLNHGDAIIGTKCAFDDPVPAVGLRSSPDDDEWNPGIKRDCRDESNGPQLRTRQTCDSGSNSAAILLAILRSRTGSVSN
ncbi:MAG: hypothetical protein ACRDG7_18450 [Candidatus Limnocylindria bacterium]